MFFVSHVRQRWRVLRAVASAAGIFNDYWGNSLSITLPSTLYIMVKNTEKITTGWDQASEISLFLKPDINAVSSQQLVARLNSWSEIDSVVYIQRMMRLKISALVRLGDAIAYLKNPLPM